LDEIEKIDENNSNPEKLKKMKESFGIDE